LDDARVLRYILQMYPDADIFTAGSGTFISLTTALDRLMPHPVYATQHWVSILNPSAATFDTVVKPLLDEAHERVARARRKVADSKSAT
jgi:hypothetical protein